MNAKKHHEAWDYTCVKVAILDALDISPETFRQLFWILTYPMHTHPRLVAQDLREACKQWLQPESLQEILEVLVINQYMKRLPPDLRAWVSQKEPSTYKKAVTLVERQRMARELTQPVKEETPQVKLAAPSPRAQAAGPPGGPRWKKAE
uniref:SCAN box domain-containing protein n=1 Tax=Chelonoidis abingdonii TaxID=106734 RepID=A0A8C0JEW6_CHEAB